MNIANILLGFEKLVVELFLWLLFIPKTLFKVVSDPSWVPGYVDEELEKEHDRFSDYLSPIPLFLICSVVVFVIIFEYDGSNDGGKNALTMVNSLKGNSGLIASLAFLALPLMFSLGTEFLQSEALTRARVQRILYIQCFYFSPAILTMLSLLVFVETDGLLLFSLALILLVVVILWFLMAEVKLFAKELQVGKLRALAIFSGTNIVLWMLALALALLFVEDFVDDGPKGEKETKETTLQIGGEHSIVVKGYYPESAGSYTLDFTKQDVLATCLPVQHAVEVGKLSVCTFKAQKGDKISISVTPEAELDVVFDVQQEGVSVLNEGYGKDLLGLLGYLYLLMIGYAVMKGIRSMFRRAET